MTPITVTAPQEMNEQIADAVLKQLAPGFIEVMQRAAGLQVGTVQPSVPKFCSHCGHPIAQGAHQ